LPWPAPQSNITYIDADSDRLRVREQIVDDKGQESAVTLEARFDGNDYPVTGSPHADAVAYRRIDQHTISGYIKKASAVLLKEKVVISAGSKKMTSTYFAADSPDSTSLGFAVFDKQ
jgi:hypothetical protein